MRRSASWLSLLHARCQGQAHMHISACARGTGWYAVLTQLAKVLLCMLSAQKQEHVQPLVFSHIWPMGTWRTSAERMQLAQLKLLNTDCQQYVCLTLLTPWSLAMLLVALTMPRWIVQSPSLCAPKTAQLQVWYAQSPQSVDFWIDAAGIAQNPDKAEVVPTFIG